jgi:SAM-dependent methyltransferase
VAARARYGLTVASRTLGVMRARVSERFAPTANRSGAAAVPFNVMFGQRLLEPLRDECARLSAFDLYLYDVMTSPRLRGQIRFEYGTLLRSVESWRGLRVLDIGSGRSTLPHWMSAQGAIVTTFDLPAPAEPTVGGLLGRVNGVVSSRPGRVSSAAGSMRQLPFRDGAFDLVTCLSVLEHLDCDLPSRTYVEYPEQCRRLEQTLGEMERVTAIGGRVYVTSECRDRALATSDAWRPAYYHTGGPPISSAWPVDDVEPLFHGRFARRGWTLVGGMQFDPLTIAEPLNWTFRGPYISGFALLAEKR